MACPRPSHQPPIQAMKKHKKGLGVPLAKASGRLATTTLTLTIGANTPHSPFNIGSLIHKVEMIVSDFVRKATFGTNIVAWCSVSERIGWFSDKLTADKGRTEGRRDLLTVLSRFQPAPHIISRTSGTCSSTLTRAPWSATTTCAHASPTPASTRILTSAPALRLERAGAPYTNGS